MGFPCNRTLTARPFCISQIPAGTLLLSLGMVGKSKWLAKGRSIKWYNINKLCGTICQINPLEQALVCSYNYTEYDGQLVAINSVRAECHKLCKLHKLRTSLKLSRVRRTFSPIKLSILSLSTYIITPPSWILQLFIPWADKSTFPRGANFTACIHNTPKLKKM